MGERSPEAEGQASGVDGRSGGDARDCSSYSDRAWGNIMKVPVGAMRGLQRDSYACFPLV